MIDEFWTFIHRVGVSSFGLLICLTRAKVVSQHVLKIWFLQNLDLLCTCVSMRFDRLMHQAIPCPRSVIQMIPLPHPIAAHVENLGFGFQAIVVTACSS